jgi:TonB family protein
MVLALSVWLPLAGALAEPEQEGQRLIQLGDLQRRQGKRDAAKDTYRKAVKTLGEKAEAVPAITALGAMAFVGGDLGAAEKFFQKAQVLDFVKCGEATAWMAMVRERQGRPQEAESLFRSALAMQKAGSLESATTMELYGSLLYRAERHDESNALLARALEIRRRVEPAVYAAAEPQPGLRVGGEVKAPKLLTRVEPHYTDEAVAAKYQGTVVLTAEIQTDGRARNIRIRRGLGLGLNERAADAVAEWRFQPGMKGGQPVPVVATIEVKYRLL